MSTIEHTSTSSLSRIPIGRRIAELLQERGDAFSIRAFAPRIGMNRETFRVTLTGERPITLSTLEKVAEALGITEERLRQLDTRKKEEELASLLNATHRNKVMLLRAHTIANDLVEVALGVTERGVALNNLGRVQYLQRNFDYAHEIWLRAYEFATKLQEGFDDKQLLHLVSGNLMLTYTMRREYSNIESMLQVVEQAFKDDPKALGTAFFTRMRIAEDRGNTELAREHACRSLEFFEQTKDNRQIGHGLINLAHCEYLLGNYESAANALYNAVQILQPFEPILILAVKEYVKSLMQLEDYQRVVQVVDQYSSLAKQYPEYWGKLKIMYARAIDSPSFAEAVIVDPSVSKEVRYYACKSLVEYYMLKRDFELAVRYYEKSRIFTKSEYLNEGGF